MERGFTVTACAWQADVPPDAPDNPHLMTLDAPTVAAEGSVSCEIVVDEPLTVPRWVRVTTAPTKWLLAALHGQR